MRSAVAIAKANGAKVYFDPGPRAFTFRGGDAERVEALDCILKDADVVLATLEEAAAPWTPEPAETAETARWKQGTARSEEQRSVPGFLSPVVPN